MISLFMSSCPQTSAENKYQTEHQKGLALLAYGLKTLYGLDSVPMIGYGVHGKPCFKYRKDIHFNISHCDGFVACAISDAPVGVDVERIASFSENLLRRVLTQEEQDQLFYHPKDSPEYLEKFYRFWTLKESAVKQSGNGLSQELRDISFRLGDGIGCSQPQLYFWQKKVTESHILSLCSERPISAEEVAEYILEE